MPGNFLTWIFKEKTNLQSQEAQEIPNMMISKRFTPRLIIIKLLFKRQRENLESNREIMIYHIEENSNDITAYFLSETSSPKNT